MTQDPKRFLTVNECRELMGYEVGHSRQLAPVPPGTFGFVPYLGLLVACVAAAVGVGRAVWRWLG